MITQERTEDFTILGLLRAMPFAILLWLMLWANINSSPWYLKNHHGILGQIHAIRSLLPFLAIVMAGIIIALRGVSSGFSLSSPVRLMVLYGLIGLGSSMLSKKPMSALYWGCLYISVFVVLESFISKPDSIRRANQLVIANWLIVGAYALILIVVGRHEMFGQGMKLIGYGIIHRIPTVMEMSMSRSSGIGRFAAVPAIIAFSRLLHAKGSLKFLWVIPFTLFTAVVITMQSRGAVFGFAAAICVVLLLHRANIRMIFIIAFIIISAIYIDKGIPDKTVRYIYRGQDRVAFLTLTGRTHTWERGWGLFKDSPLVGFGPQADRYSLHGEHMHNAYLYALTQSGLIGTVPFVAAWLLGWLQFGRILRRKNDLPDQQRLLLFEAGAVFAFFTVRSIPEASAAFYGVDLLVMVPILAYINILYTSFRIHDLTFNKYPQITQITRIKYNER
jgi:O-antigen ligase